MTTDHTGVLRDVREALDRGGFHAVRSEKREDSLFIYAAIVRLDALLADVPDSALDKFSDPECYRTKDHYFPGKPVRYVVTISPEERNFIRALLCAAARGKDE